MNVLSLFSGIGGLELGLERAGMTVVGQVELDEFCRDVLSKHWPEVPRHDDVRTAVDWWRAEPRPAVHVVAGGFPCQPFSQAGDRRGIADERWGWPWMFDVVRDLRPRYVVVENVPALVDDADAFGWMLGDLAEIGFDAEWSVLSACALAAPHTRERLFLVAHTTLDDEQDQGEDPSSAGGLRRQPRGSGRAPRREWRWLPEPAVDRMADGVPIGLVRSPLHAYGNAVVPEVAEYVGHVVMSHASAEVPA